MPKLLPFFGYRSPILVFRSCGQAAHNLCNLAGISSHFVHSMCSSKKQLFIKTLVFAQLNHPLLAPLYTLVSLNLTGVFHDFYTLSTEPIKITTVYIHN